MKSRRVRISLWILITAATLLPVVNAQQFSDWSVPVTIGPPVNTPSEDYQPFITKDGLSLYFPRIDRPGTNQDIWVAHRTSTSDPWGTPERLPATINTPTRLEGTPFVTVDGHWLYFGGASTRTPLPGFGANDIWISYRADKRFESGPGGWQTPVNLGPNINTAAGEAGPWLLEDEEAGALTLYFHSNRFGNNDLFSSTLQPDGTFAPAEPVSELNTGFAESSPSVSHNGREIYFDSDRSGSVVGEDGVTPSTDIWRATRESTSDPWSPPEPVSVLNTPLHEGRPSLSFDGSTLYFFAAGRPENVTILFDIWKTNRSKLHGPE